MRDGEMSGRGKDWTAPCPWCGGSARADNENKSGLYMVLCSGEHGMCIAGGPLRGERQDAIEEWNRVSDCHSESAVRQQAMKECWRIVRPADCDRGQPPEVLRERNLLAAAILALACLDGPIPSSPSPAPADKEG